MIDALPLCPLPSRIASIDFRPPYVLSGSSDKHLRLFDITTLHGWSTSPESEMSRTAAAYPFYDDGPPATCRTCGFSTGGSGVHRIGGGSGRVSEEGGDGTAGTVHGDLVRSVALGEDFALSGSYDLSIKVRRSRLANTGLLIRVQGLGSPNGCAHCRPDRRSHGADILHRV